MRRLSVIVLVVATLMVVGAVPASAKDPRLEIPDPSPPPASKVFTGLDEVYAQKLKWEKCGLGFECAWARVPVDYDDLAQGSTHLRMIRLPVDVPTKGSLFVNPGGPGGSGVNFLREWPLGVGLAPGNAASLFENYVATSFDPRGVGLSDPLRCLDDKGLDALLAADASPDSSEETAEARRLVTKQGKACEKNSGALASHVSTVEAARDMDVMRALVGDEKLNYLGFSWGTFLGSTYAALFPEKVGRMVLDGAVDPSQSVSQAGLGQAGGFETAVSAWAASCVAGTTVHPTCPLGGTVDEVKGNVRGLLDALDAEPLPTGDPARPLTQSLAFYGVIEPLYSDSEWDALTTALAEARKGRGKALLKLADGYTDRTRKGYATNLQQVESAYNCLDALANPNQTVEPKSKFEAASPTFANELWSAADVGCGAWPLRPSVTWPDYSAPGAPPILVIGTSRDPATPYENSVTLARILSSGVLVSRDGDGHTAFGGANSCVNRTVVDFLVNAVVPDGDKSCGVDDPRPTTTTVVPRSKGSN